MKQIYADTKLFVEVCNFDPVDFYTTLDFPNQTL